MGNDNAQDARDGLIGGIAGKAKEVVGAVAGKDDLVEEGQLQQTEAQRRKEAVADEAVADAKRHEATQEMREASRETAEEQGEARARAEQERSAAAQQAAQERAAAERGAAQREQQGRVNAEVEADLVAETRLREAEVAEAQADATEERTTEEQARLAREAATAEQQAAQLRAETDQPGTEK